VSAPELLPEVFSVFLEQDAGCCPFQSSGDGRDRQYRRVVDQQMDVVGFPVDLDDSNVEGVGGVPDDEFRPVKDRPSEHSPPIFDNKYEVGGESEYGAGGGSDHACPECGGCRAQYFCEACCQSASAGDPEQSDVISRTMTLCNKAADLAATLGFQRNVKGKQSLQRLAYGEVKALGMSAQPALHAIRKAASAYATLAANGKAGNLGSKSGKRWGRAFGKPVSFRSDSAVSFDDRSLSWQVNAGTISIWTVEGRMQGVPFAGHPDHIADLVSYRKGETDLVSHQGGWYLVATLDLPEVPAAPVTDFIGVDMGIVVIAATSTGQSWAGDAITYRRLKNVELRAKLQKKGTKSAKRLLRKRAGKESRFVTDVNHVISKKIVTEAQRTGRGIAIEDLTGIRARARLRKPQRVALNSWAFAQLGSFITYKAEAARVDLEIIDPAYTSQECSECHYIDKKNRIDQATFVCRNCGVTLNADDNASKVIADRARKLRGAVNLPDAA
jgi:putative transposase